MAQKMSDIYKISLKDHRTRATKLLRENEACYNSLKNKDSEFARAVKALQDLHRQVQKIYRDAPGEI